MLQFISNNLSFAYNNVLYLFEVWYRKFGHRNSTNCLNYLKLVCWKIKMFFLLHLFLALFANCLKVKHFLFQLVFIVFRIALKQFIMMFGICLQLPHMLFINILPHSLMIIVLLHGYIFFALSLKCFQCLINS